MPVLTTVYYLGIVQFFPAVLCVCLELRVPSGFVTAGFLAGEAMSVGLAFSGVPVGNVNPGFIGLVLNAGMVALGLAANASRPVPRR